MKKSQRKHRSRSWLLLLLLTVGIGLINLLAHRFLVRIDLTEDQRHSIHPATKKLLGKLDGDIYVTVYLAGDLPMGFRQLQRATKELLEACKAYANRPIHYQIIDLNTEPIERRKKLLKKLSERGIQPTNLYMQEHGQRIEKLIYPGALVTYKEQEVGVMLLKGNSMTDATQMISQSIDGLEYELTKALAKLVNKVRTKVGLVKGHSEPNARQLSGLTQALSEHYELHEVILSRESPLSTYGALLITKPQQPFSEDEQYLLDQYIMQGGKVLFFLDRLRIDMDSLRSGEAFAFPRDLGLDDQLFRYGIRINQDLVQDLHAGVYPVVVGKLGNQPQLRLLSWPFFPILNNFSTHLITKNMDALYTQFVSSLDTVKVEGVVKTPLVFTSNYTRRLATPVYVALEALRKAPDLASYNQGAIPLVYLLEGQFSSLYKNRLLPAGFDPAQFTPVSQPTQLLVAASGSIVLNAIDPRQGRPLPWGYDPFLQQTFANEDFVLNSLAYMLDEAGLINTKRKTIKIRLLDRVKIEQARLKWQLVNITIPLLLLLLIGLIWNGIYRRMFT